MGKILEKLDLSKPFVKVYREDNNTVIESNLPNDQIGDFAFEWDEDGSQRKAWEDYLEGLERLGIKGNLAYNKTVMLYNEALDEPSNFNNQPLTSYKLQIVDYGK